MTAVHAMHVSWSAAHFSQERARAKMAEPVCDDKTWGGWKRWNINHRRGVYSSCHDNNNGSKTLSFLPPETNWHLIPFCSDTNWRDRRHGCRPTSPSISVPCLVSDNVTNPGGRYFQLAHSHGENIQGVSLSVWWKMLDRSLHVLTVWRTSDLLNPSLNSRGWVIPSGAIFLLQQDKHHASLETGVTLISHIYHLTHH